MRRDLRFRCTIYSHTHIYKTMFSLYHLFAYTQTAHKTTTPARGFRVSGLGLSFLLTQIYTYLYICEYSLSLCRTSLAVGSDRVITAGVLGGLVQVRIQSKRCRFVTNRFCQSMPFVVHDYSLHPNYMDVAPYEEAKQLLPFRERWSARVKVHFLKFALQSALLELMY